MSQKGSVSVLFVVFVVPAIMLTSFIAVDISRYLNLVERGQKVADDAVMAGVRFLPDKTRAREVTENYVRRGMPEGTAVVEVEDDAIALTLNVPMTFVLSKYFTNDGALFTTPLYARSREAPVDTLIALDVSNYLAPPGDTAWGQEMEWPASTLASEIRQLSSVSLSDRRITQQCFNPFISPLKRAAIGLYSYLSSFPSHAVGVAFFPGNLRSAQDSPGHPALDVTRPVETQAQRIARGLQSESAFPLYRGDNFAADERCAAFSEYDTYRDTYTSPVLNGGRTVPIVRRPYWSFDPDAERTISAADAIWNHAVVEDRQGDLPQVLAVVMDAFLRSTPHEKRGSLRDRSVRHAIILAGDMPYSGGARFPDLKVKNDLAATYRQLTALNPENNPVRVTYILSSHDPVKTSSLQSEALELVAFLKELEGSMAPPMITTVIVADINEVYPRALARTKAIRTSLIGR